MAMIQCKECGKEISSDARVCPHCGKKRYRWGVGKILLAAFGVAVIIGAVISSLQQPGTPKAKVKENICTAIDAVTVAQGFIKKQLLAPATAHFQDVDRAASARIGSKKNCEWEVQTYVDAQNAFGAKLRAHYDVKLFLIDLKNGRFTGTLEHLVQYQPAS